MNVSEDEEHRPFIDSEINEEPSRKALVKKKLKHISYAKKTKQWIPLSPEDIREYYANLFPLLRGIRRTPADDIKAKARNINNTSSKDMLLYGLTLNEFYKNILSGSSAESPNLGGSSDNKLSINDKGASEQSFKSRKFFFELGAELIVYGRTEPDAKVTHQGKDIPLRSDGTFTLRFALPDGKIPLDFTATSADKVESKSITTKVERYKTEYKDS
jgi:hypothetical protein